MTTNALWHIDHCKGPLRRIMDLGAYHGEFTLEAARRGAGKVYAFEVNESNFQQLQINVGFEQRIHAGNLGVINKESDSYSLRGNGAACHIIVNPEGTLKNVIPFIDLVKLLAPIDYLKIDIEGMEHMIFDDHKLDMAKAMKEVGFLQLEIHKSMPTRSGRMTEEEYSQRINDIINILGIYGFTDRPCDVRQEHPEETLIEPDALLLEHPLDSKRYQHEQHDEAKGVEHVVASALEQRPDKVLVEEVHGLLLGAEH